ncbi:MAG TPA: ATP-binding protein [Gemmatimonadaceae bacterium]|nr:ATP-binding protein [Gemmatimonadaceae bacterium]
MTTVEPAEGPFIALLVEDNPADAELIALRLKPSHHHAWQAPVHLVRATTMASACATLRATTVDVIILDLSLPDATRLEALHQVRVAAPGIPVIVLTGKEDEAMALEALRAGAQEYVLKPPPDGPGFHRILRYARERHRILEKLDSAMRSSAMLARRWQLLAEVGKTLAAWPTPERALCEVAQLLVPGAADCAVLYLSGDAEFRTVVEVAHVEQGEAPEMRDRVAALLGDPASEAYRLLDELDANDAMRGGPARDAVQRLFASLGVTSGTVLPLRAGDRIRGLLLLANTAHRQDGVAVDEGLARPLADRIGLALDHALLVRQAELSTAARDRAIGIVSHDLGNPLTAIEICAAALLDASPPPVSGVRNMGQLIQHATALMRRIVSDLLDRASLDAGRLRLERESTTVADVMRDVQAMFAASAAERELDFVIRCDEELPSVNADPSRLIQILSNLLSNAIKFTPRHGRVVLSARLAAIERSDTTALGIGASAVEFTVSDTGPGIPALDLRHVFDWFWHSQRGRSGTGLGLAIARGLVEAHGGDLRVESEPGQGSTFWFSIAATQDQQAYAS